jgi:hypothetical protein
MLRLGNKTAVSVADWFKLRVLGSKFIVGVLLGSTPWGFYSTGF